MNSPESDQIRVAFWNLQNLFDIVPSPMAFELGMTAINGWDRRALEARMANLASAIRSMFDGHGPDLLGLAEVENDRVAQLLLSALNREDYALVTASHPLVTATGTALIYSKRQFDEDSLRVQSHIVHQRFPTCDILEVHLGLRSNQSELAVLVNHWPSRREAESDAFRRTVASYCSRVVEQQVKLSRRDFVELSDTELSRQHLRDRWNHNLLLMGSFNDEPWDRGVRSILNAGNRMRSMRSPVPFPHHTLPSWRAYSACQPELFNTSWSLFARPDQATAVDRLTGAPLGVLDHLILSRGLVTGQSGLRVSTDEQGMPAINFPATTVAADGNGYPVPFSCDTYEGFSDRLPLSLVLKPCRRGDADGSVVADDREDTAALDGSLAE